MDSCVTHPSSSGFALISPSSKDIKLENVSSNLLMGIVCKFLCIAEKAKFLLVSVFLKS